MDKNELISILEDAGMIQRPTPECKRCVHLATMRDIYGAIDGLTFNFIFDTVKVFGGSSDFIHEGHLLFNIRNEDIISGKSDLRGHNPVFTMEIMTKQKRLGPTEIIEYFEE